MFRLGSLVVVVFLLQVAYSQQLIINEVSQGVVSNGEYVEFVVIGTPTCVTPVPTVDLRTVIFDDNNGYFASGTGMGIASGAIRFANNSFWQNIPQGTIIVIYDNSSPNTNLPPDDLSLTDGNCKLVIPINATLFEKATISPTTANSAYPPTGNWTPGTTWSPLGMANGGDSFQLPLSTNTTVPFHAVSWGNNSTNPIIYFAGSATNTVYSFKNTVSNNWNTQGNWAAGANSSDETPGAPNSPQNAAWIASLNPQCGITSPMSIAPVVVNETCLGACNGSVSVTINNGIGPYTYSWSNGQTSAAISNLCAGNYAVTVIGSNGCSAAQSFSVLAGTTSPIATIQAAGPFLSNSPTTQLVGSPAGGTWSSNCSTCLTSTGIFDPSDAGVGTFQVCYQVGSGVCTSDTCISITVNLPCAIQTTITATSINESCVGACNGSASVSVNTGVSPYLYAWSNGQTTATISNLCAGNYTVTVTGANGCSGTQTVSVLTNVTTLIATIQAAGPFLSNSPTTQLVGSPTGGTWSSNCSTCLTATGVFNPSIAGVGTFQVCYQVGTGVCATDTCILLLVNAPCVPQTTSSNSVICPEDSVLLFGNWEHLPGAYSGAFIDQNGCDSSHVINLSLYTVNPIQENVIVCEGDSVFVFNTWYFDNATLSQQEQTSEGCSVVHSVTIALENCEFEIPTIFIPNVFTPNTDNVNDTFEIVIYGGLVEQAYILNRWGEQVHAFDPNYLKWDGTNDATKQRVSDGVYTYVVYFKPSESPIEVHTGFVTIIR
jgi:gliding motility-associated-like protein